MKTETVGGDWITTVHQTEDKHNSNDSETFASCNQLKKKTFREKLMNPKSEFFLIYTGTLCISHGSVCERQRTLER